MEFLLWVYYSAATRPEATQQTSVQIDKKKYRMLTRCNQSIKIDTDLSIDKSVKIVWIDLIDIDCIDQSVEIDNARIFFIDCCWLIVNDFIDF